MENGWDNSDQTVDVDMQELLLVVWRKAWLIVLAAILCGALCFGVVKYVVTPQYRSSVLFYVNNASVSADGLISSLVSEELTVAQQIVDTYEVILQTKTTLDEVVAAAALDVDTETLSRQIEISEVMMLERVEATELFHVHLTWPDPAEAEKLAKAMAEVLPRRISEIIDDTSARIVDSAVLPTEPYSPDPKNSLILGAMLGVVMSAGFYVIRYLFDSRIRSSSELSRYSNLPILAVIPDVGKQKR